MTAFLSKIIIKSITKVVKNTAKFDLAVDDLNDQFKNSCPPKEDLLRIVKQKNQIQTGLSSIVGVLTTLESTTSTAENLLTGLQTAIRVIKVLPIPTGLGLPVGIITTFADALDTLGDVVKGGKGAIKIIPQALDTIIKSAQNIIQKLNTLDLAINVCVEELSEGMTQEEKNELISEINATAATSGDFSNDLLNSSTEDALLERLKPNSNNPLEYKGFKLEIDFDANNEFSFPSRRIIGRNAEVGMIIYNLEDAGYSYSTSVKVLIDEIKFRIDLIPAFRLATLANEEVTRGGGTNNSEEEETTPPPVETQLNPPPPPPPPPDATISGNTSISLPSLNTVEAGTITVTNAPVTVKFSVTAGMGSTVRGRMRYTVNDVPRDILQSLSGMTREETFTYSQNGTYNYELRVLFNNLQTGDTDSNIRFEILD